MNTELEKYFITDITGIQGKLGAYIHTLIPMNHAEQDVLQETNMVLWAKRDQFQPGTNFNAWAYKVAYLQCKAYLKTHRRSLSFNDELLTLISEETVANLEFYNDKKEYLEQCIKKLEIKDQKILRLYYFENHTLNTISEIVHRSVGALQQVMFRIRNDLRQCITNSLREDNL